MRHEPLRMDAKTGILKKRVASFVLLSALTTLLLAGCTPQSRFNPSAGWSGVALSAEVLFVGSMEGQLLALDQETGELRWQFPKDFPGQEERLESIYGTPAVADSKVFVGEFAPRESRGKLYALDWEQRKVAWAVDWVGPIVGSPTVAGSQVIVGSDDGFLYAFDIEYGKPLWQFPVEGSSPIGQVWSTPTVADGLVYFGSMDHKVYALDIVTGEKMWEFETGGVVYSPPLVEAGRVYVGSFDRYFYALDGQTGEQLWKFNADNWFWGQAASEGTRLYVPSLDGSLYVLDSKTGLRLWAVDTEGPILSSPVVVDDGLVAVASDSGNLFLVNVKQERNEWTNQIDAKIRAPLVSFEGVVYLNAMDHTVRAMDMIGKKQKWCWATKKEERC